MMAKIGQTIATLHDAGLIHGDLTTSNMLIRKSDSAVVSLQLLLLSRYCMQLLLFSKVLLLLVHCMRLVLLSC